MVINALGSGAKTFMADFEGELDVKIGRRALAQRADRLIPMLSCRLKLADVEQYGQRTGQLVRRDQETDRF